MRMQQQQPQQQQQRRRQYDWMVVMILSAVLGWGTGGVGTTDTTRPYSAVVLAFTSRVARPFVTTHPMSNRRSSIPSMKTILFTGTSAIRHPSGKNWIRMHPSFKNTKIGASKDDHPRDYDTKSWMEDATDFEVSMIEKALWSSSPHKHNEVVDLQEDTSVTTSMVNNNCRSKGENKPRYTRILSRGMATVFLVVSIMGAEGFLAAQPALAFTRSEEKMIIKSLDDLSDQMKKNKEDRTVQYEKTVVMFEKINNKIDEQKNSYVWVPVVSGVLSGALSALVAAVINGYALYLIKRRRILSMGGTLPPKDAEKTVEERHKSSSSRCDKNCSS